MEQASAVCRACRASPPAFDATIAACDYAAPIDRLVLNLKFGAGLPLAQLFADQILESLLRKAAPDLPLPDCLAIVPLGPARLQQRGFNQSLEIAKPLATALGVQLVPRMLARARETVAQSRLSLSARRRNLHGAFTLLPQTIASVRGVHVGVVDDVMTTGETLNEVAATLKFFGAARVTNLVFARTL
ncbi:MAG: phosphoribosyltransferase family protein [Pseudomonadota bacterium]